MNFLITLHWSCVALYFLFLVFTFLADLKPPLPYNPNTYSVFNICSTLDVLYILDSFYYLMFCLARASRWLWLSYCLLNIASFGARFSTYECRDASEKSIYKHIRYSRLCYATLSYLVFYPYFPPLLTFLPACLLASLPRCLLWGYTLASMHALLCMIILVVHLRSSSRP